MRPAESATRNDQVRPREDAIENSASDAVGSDEELRSVVVGLVFQLTLRAHQLAAVSSAAHIVQPALSAARRVLLKDVRPIRYCGQLAAINRDGLCDTCLLYRGYRRCQDCGVPVKARSLDLRGLCRRCGHRSRWPLSGKTVSGGLPTHGNRRLIDRTIARRRDSAWYRWAARFDPDTRFLPWASQSSSQS